MQDNPLPCPFCSSAPIVSQRSSILTVTCTCDGKRFVQTYGKSRMEAVESWNQRAAAEAMDWRKRALWAEAADRQLRPLTRQLMAAMQAIAIEEDATTANEIACKALVNPIKPDQPAIPQEPDATIYAEVCRLHEEHQGFVLAGQILADLKEFIENLHSTIAAVHQPVVKKGESL